MTSVTDFRLTSKDYEVMPLYRWKYNYETEKLCDEKSFLNNVSQQLEIEEYIREAVRSGVGNKRSQKVNILEERLVITTNEQGFLQYMNDLIAIPTPITENNFSFPRHVSLLTMENNTLKTVMEEKNGGRSTIPFYISLIHCLVILNRHELIEYIINRTQRIEEAIRNLLPPETKLTKAQQDQYCTNVLSDYCTQWWELAMSCNAYETLKVLLQGFKSVYARLKEEDWAEFLGHLVHEVYDDPNRIWSIIYFLQSKDSPFFGNEKLLLTMIKNIMVASLHTPSDRMAGLFFLMCSNLSDGHMNQVLADGLIINQLALTGHFGQLRCISSIYRIEPKQILAERLEPTDNGKSVSMNIWIAILQGFMFSYATACQQGLSPEAARQESWNIYSNFVGLIINEYQIGLDYKPEIVESILQMFIRDPRTFRDISTFLVQALCLVHEMSRQSGKMQDMLFTPNPLPGFRVIGQLEDLRETLDLIRHGLKFLNLEVEDSDFSPILQKEQSFVNQVNCYNKVNAKKSPDLKQYIQVPLDLCSLMTKTLFGTNKSTRLICVKNLKEVLNIVNRLRLPGQVKSEFIQNTLATFLQSFYDAS